MLIKKVAKYTDHTSYLVQPNAVFTKAPGGAVKKIRKKISNPRGHSDDNSFRLGNAFRHGCSKILNGLIKRYTQEW